MTISTRVNDLSEVVAADKAHIWHHLFQHKSLETADPRVIVDADAVKSKNLPNCAQGRRADVVCISGQQAFGTRPNHPALHAFTQDFLAAAKSDGLVAELIDRHGVTGKLQVAGGNP